MNKYKLYMIMGIILLVLSITGSLAYYFWRSSSDTLLSGNLCLPEISFTGGATINGKLKPVASKEEGLIKEVEVNLHKTCNNDTAVMNLYLSLDLLPTELQENTFVYELYNGDNERISSGNFSDKREGDTITLAENEIVTSDVSIYTLYIYIDGNRDNPITMSNKNFRFNIYGEGTGAIYKENVIKNETTTPSSSSSTFLNTEVLRNEIESITIEKSNVVPSDVKYSKDISSKQDGSVILWYTDKDNNNLYEVSIGSENGVVEANTNGSGMFAYLDNVSSLDLSGLDTSNMTSMSRMFYNSTSLTNIDVSGFDTTKVVNMNEMFAGCNNLEKINLSNFDTSKVTNMRSMFQGCKSLINLDLSNFDTTNTTGFSMMFGGCSALESLNLSGFKFKNSLSSLFHNCSSLENLNLTSVIATNVTTLQDTFVNCSKLETLDLSNFDVSNLKERLALHQTFSGCSNLKTLNLTGWKVPSGVTFLYATFKNCSSLTSLDLSTWDTSGVTSMEQTFYNCNSLKTLNLNGWDTSKVTTMFWMFQYCKSLESLDLSSFNFSGITNGSILTFNGCSSLKTVIFGKNIDTSKITNMGGMFYNCSSLETLDLSMFDTSNVTTMAQMFKGCKNLKSFNLSGWDTSKVTDLSQMFHGCTSLEALDLSMFITPLLENMGLMFHGCASLKKINLSNVTFDNEVDIGGIFSGCKVLEEIDIRKADFSNAKYPTTGYVPFLSVPNNVKIIVKDDTIKSWFNTNFSNFTNVVVG